MQAMQQDAVNHAKKCRCSGMGGYNGDLENGGNEIMGNEMIGNKTINELLIDKDAFRDKLKEKGFQQQQINSRIANAIIETLAENEGLFISELKYQVDSISEKVHGINARLNQIYSRNEEVVNKTSELIKAIEDSKDISSNINDERTKDLLVAFNGMLHICTLYKGLDMIEALRSIGYIMYAFYCGKSKEEYKEEFKEVK